MLCFFAVFVCMKQYGVHVTGCVEVVSSVSLSLLSSSKQQPSDFITRPLLGQKNAGFNWSLFGPFGVQLIESDPSVGRSLFFQRDD